MTKNILFVFILFSLFSSAENLSKKSITPGQIWKDDKGMNINAQGGGILFQDGIYYWYGEDNVKDTIGTKVYVNCYSSKDLLNWKFEGVSLAAATNNDRLGLPNGCVLERPKVIYNAKTKKYVMWFHLELKGQGYKAARVGLAVSDNVKGPFQYVRSYRPNAGKYPVNMSSEQKNSAITVADFPKSWTTEWRKAVEDGLFVRRDLAGGQMSRDMTIFVDDNGKAYHIYASEENQTIQIAELSDDYMSHTGRYVRILEGKHNEAPTVLKKNGKYFLITSDCTGWTPNAARMAVADSLFGTWTELANPCVGTDANLSFNSQGTYILKIEGKKDAFVFMADRWITKTPNERRYIWLPILFENGKPVLKWFDNWKLNAFPTK
ncbi:MAG: glycoside hydrolase family 43 protein [Paludibacter sp.]